MEQANPRQDAPPRCHTPRQAAELLGVSPDSVRRWIESNELHAVRLGPRTLRIENAELERFLARKRQA